MKNYLTVGRFFVIATCIIFISLASVAVSNFFTVTKVFTEVRQPRHTITIYSNATYDGYAFSASSSALPDPNPDEWGDGSDSTSLLMYVGEYSFFRAGEAFNFRNRSFLAFPLDSIPAGAIILSATLYINLNNNTATVDDVGDCIIDHIGNYTPLDRTDYQIVPLTANIATLATPATLPGLLSIPGLESYVQDDLLNSRPYTHFRLRQSTGGDTPTEATPSEREIFRVYNFTTGDSIVKPYLEIIYSRPPNPPINLGVQGFADGTEEALNITSHTPTLNWTFSDPDAGDTQSAYNVSVIRVSDGVLMWFKNDTGANNTVIYNETGGGIAALELIDCNDYYFRVQTQDNHGLWGDWAEMRFHMNTLPTTMLVAPANDTWINDNTPLFDWDYFDVEGSPQCAFNLTISSNSDFSTIDYYYESAPSYSDTYYDWPSALPDGIWYWRVKTNDSYEWGEWSEYFIMKIDTVLPTSTIETPFVDPAYYKTSPIWLNGTCLDDRSGINRMEIKIVWKDNGTIYLDWRTTNLAANYSWWDYSFQPPNEANFTIYIRAVDNASNYQVAITRNVTYDITLPTSTIETPFADPAYYNTAPISLDGTCSDTLSGINRVEIKIIWKDNGTIYLDWSNANLAADYSWWDYSFEPPNGANFTIYVRAVDNASNYQVAITRNVTYDITLPTSTIETPSTDPAYYNTVPIWLDGACSDALSGINRVEIKIIWKDNGTIYLDWSNANLAADYSWWDYSFEPPNGANFTIYVRAVDNASNYQNAIIRNVTYDVTAPTAHVDPLPEYSNSNFLVSWSGSDTLSGVSYYTVKNSTDPLIWQDWLVETTSTSALWLISNISEGAIMYFQVEVYDRAGNSDTSGTFTTRDTIKPISNILIPEEGYATNTTIQIEGNCSDEKSGVNRTEIKISWKDNGTVYKDWHNTTLASNYTWWNYSFLPLNDANFTIYIKAVDNASNVQVNISINITYDCTPPSASQLISPASGITLDINLPTFAWKYSTDTLSGMAYYNIQVSNKSDFVYLIYEYDTLINSSTPEYTFPDDTYYWKVFAVDRAGNVNESEIAWFNISVGAPRIDKFCINNDALYTNSTLVMLTINIAYEPVNFKMRLSNDKSQWLELDYTESLSWDLANLTYGGNSTEGKKTVYIECWKEGSVNKSLELDDIVLDNTTPVIHYNYPQPGGTTAWYNTDPSNVIDIDFYWIAHAPLDYAKYRIGNNPWVEIFTENRFSDCTLNWNVSWGLLNEGENQISIRVADCAGNFLEHDYNYTLGKGFIFRKDTKAPLAPNLFVPANGTTINYTEVAFSWESANDSLPSSGIAKYIIEIYDIYDIEQPSYRYDVYTNHITQNLTDGTYYWRIRAVDNANNFGNWSPMFNFILDTLAPKNIIFLINGGATETSSEEVYLIIYAENTDRIRLWNEGSVEPTTWMNYTTFLNWTLAEVPYNASEERTVWLKCLNNKTNRSANKYASILVNKITPWVRIKDHARFINATQFTLYWEPFVDLDFIKKFEILEEGKESWVDVEKNLSFTFYGLSQGYHNFYVRATDVGDRVGAPNSTFICVDLLPPTSLSLIVNEGAGYTNSTSAVLDINAVENFSVTRQVAGIDKYYISNNGYDWLEYNCTQFPESLVWNLILGIENIDGSKTVYFKVKDRAGNYAIVNATVFLDRLKPTNLKIDLPQTTNSTSIALILFAEDPGIASGLLEMCFSEDGINWGAWINGAWVSNGWVAYSSSYTYKLQNGHDGSKTIYFRVRDRSGNENCTSAQTILDRSPKLKSPINYAIINSNNTLLVWERNTPDIGVYSYIVELDDNIDFVSPESFSVNSTSYLISNLTHNTAYFWRVKMKVNGNESFWSEIWSFIVKFPDLSISEDDISFYPVSIVAVWQEVIINLTVHNIGESNAENIVVNFYQDYPYPMARLLGNGTIELIEKGGVAQISIPAIFTVAAEFTVSVVIDPYNTISEIDKENNFAYRSLKVVSFFDVLPINITVAVGNIIEPSYIFENDTITIIAKIKNQGGDIVIPFTAEFWIGKFENGFFNGTLAGKREIQRIAEGEVISDISIDWVASEVGDFAIRLFLNTTGIFKERADNNELFRNITVYYKTALRLSVLEKSVETETEGEVYYNITIENIGLIQDTYDLTVEGLPSDWNYSIIYEGNEIDSITLDVAKSLQIQLRIKTTKEPLGDNKFKFTATSRKDPRAIYELELITKLVAPPPPPLVPPSFPWYLVILGIISAIIISTSPWIVLKVVRKTAKIDEIFLLYSDGRLIKHFTRRLRPYRDEDIIAGMLTAVRGFVKDVFKGEPGMLEEMKFGEMRFIISSGKYIVIAAVFVGKRGVEIIKKDIKRVIDYCEREYEKVLIDWDGDLAKVIPLSKHIEKLLT